MTQPSKPIYVRASDAFISAQTIPELKVAGQALAPEIERLNNNGSRSDQGIYLSIRNAYKYYYDLLSRGINP